MSLRRFALTLCPALAVASATTAAWLTASAQDPAPQQAPFRSTVSGVAVHVSVRRGDAAVSGLTAADFSVSAGGVRQPIATMTSGRVPIDLTLVVDQDFGASRSGEIRGLAADFAARLDGDDRLRLVMAAGDIWERPVGAPAPAAAPMAPPFAKGALSSVLDAIAIALATPAAPGRQHLVFVVAGGIDAMSIADQDGLLDMAERADAQVHVMFADLEDTTPPRVRTPVRATLDARNLMVDLTRLTGGERLWRPMLGRSIPQAFGRLIEAVRSGYILYFVPQGLKESGWQDISVTVTRPGAYRVHARPGYSQ